MHLQRSSSSSRSCPEDNRLANPQELHRSLRILWNCRNTLNVYQRLRRSCCATLSPHTSQIRVLFWYRTARLRRLDGNLEDCQLFDLSTRPTLQLAMCSLKWETTIFAICHALAQLLGTIVNDDALKPRSSFLASLERSRMFVST
jgi:hypothetical protein